MKILSEESKSRIMQWVNALKEDLYTPLGSISWESCACDGCISPQKIAKKDYKGVKAGFSWGEEWQYRWFHSEIVMPEEARGKRIVMKLSPGGESTLFVNGEAFGTYRRDFAITEKHHYFEDNTLTRCAVPGEKFDILTETYAGHDFEEKYPGCGMGPIIPGKEMHGKADGERAVLGESTYGIWNEIAYRLYMDADTLIKLLPVLDDTSLRAQKIASALEKFTYAVKFECSPEKRDASYKEGIKILEPLLSAVNGSTAPVFYAVGNAHIDLSWLWPFEETYRKCARTFAAQLRLIDEYPDYKFIQSQPALYEMCRTYYPRLFKRIKKAVKNGQWIADGGMWVEPDTNMTGGESLIRQLMYGKRYYKEMFGVNSELLWLPDSFGYSASLPQILKGCNMKYLVTQKIFWSYNDSERFPYHYFNWRGNDGSEIISFLPTSYTYKTDPTEVNTVWKNRNGDNELDAFLYPFGYGDGGGGPARDYIEYAERQKNLEGGVKMKLASPTEFFASMGDKPENTYSGELYFTAHRGTYTTQAAIKKYNRQCELGLRELEMLGAFASLDGAEYPKEKAEEIWKTVLLHQFHDILPGSSIKRVYEKARKTYAETLGMIDRLKADLAGKLIKADETAVTVFNSLGFTRNAEIKLPVAFKNGAVLNGGTEIPVFESEEGIRAEIVLPPCGAISLTPSEKAVKKEIRKNIAYTSGDCFILENRYIKAVINKKGEITSYILKESGREFAASPMNVFHMYEDIPRIFDAWDIDSNYLNNELDGAYDISLTFRDFGYKGVIYVSGKIGGSTYKQEIKLEYNGKRIEFETEVDWRELHKLLKVSFPVGVYSENAVNEIQYGYIERPTHRSRRYDKDRFEVCNHRYSAIFDNGCGGAVLNDCKYGISVNGNSLELTLLRAAASPEMRTDNGINTFTYAFTAWNGSFSDCDVVKQGYELNVRPYMIYGGQADFSMLQSLTDNIIADTVKPAEDGSGDIIIRLYESKKASTDAAIKINMPYLTVYECDMLENNKSALMCENGILNLTLRAFEVKTIRISLKK